MKVKKILKDGDFTASGINTYYIAEYEDGTTQRSGTVWKKDYKNNDQFLIAEFEELERFKKSLNYNGDIFQNNKKIIVSKEGTSFIK